MIIRRILWDSNKDKFQLGKVAIKGLNTHGMVVQKVLEFFFAPALIAQPDVRAAGSTDSPAAEPRPAAAAESTQASLSTRTCGIAGIDRFRFKNCPGLEANARR